MKLLLDSFALIEFFKGSKIGEKVKNYAEKDEVVFSVLSLYEVGLRIEQDYSKKEAEDCMRSLRTHYQTIDVDGKIALKAVEIKREFKLPTVDSLIYAATKIN